VLRVDEAELDWDDHDMPSYRGEPFTGEVAEYGPDRQLLSLTSYVDGRLDGPFRVWTRTGVLIVEGRSRRGDTVGTQREWYPSGTRKVERAYDDDGELRRVTRWDERGNVTSDETYER
jgi:antitoxin component YwqK of YwqJK toxin-antitoxin module